MRVQVAVEGLAPFCSFFPPPISPQVLERVVTTSRTLSYVSNPGELFPISKIRYLVLSPRILVSHFFLFLF